MTREEAVDTLIAHAVCADNGMHCTDQCPVYKEELSNHRQQEICAKAVAREKIVTAVGILTGNLEER